MLEELDSLTSKLLDGGLDEDDRHRLNELLAG